MNLDDMRKLREKRCLLQNAGGHVLHELHKAAGNEKGA